MKINIRVKATFIKERRILQFIMQCRTIIFKMEGDKIFNNPHSPYADINKAIKNLGDAQMMTQVREPGAIDERDVHLQKVLTYLRSCQNYVQDLADNEDDEKKANAIILASGFTVRIKPFIVKLPFKVKQDKNSGDIILRVKSAGTKAIYEWQQSTDNGENFVHLAPTSKAGTEVSGYVPYQKICFRFRSHTSFYSSEWSTPITFTPDKIIVPATMPNKIK
jgi:hypothetical protein